MASQAADEARHIEHRDDSGVSRADSRQVVVSSVRPTSVIHIGNYFGALRNWVRLQDDDDHRRIYGIADIHSLPPIRNEPAIAQQHATERREFTRRMVVDLLAIGINPEKSILFVQPLVPEHSEMHWLFSCLCPYKKLKRMPIWETYKSISRPTSIILPALLIHPVLQAADILAYRAVSVPAGRDQERHIEVARTIASHFNRTFWSLFPLSQVMPRTPIQINGLPNPSQIMKRRVGKSESDWD